MCAERLGWHWKGEECDACGRLTKEKDRGVSLVAVECDNCEQLPKFWPWSCARRQCFTFYGSWEGEQSLQEEAITSQPLSIAT